jgi:hypothetical protein
MNKSLSLLLKYKNQFVLDRYKKDHSQNNMLAPEAFSELIKYMWLCCQHKNDQQKSQDPDLNFNCVMHYEMREIDDMWHTFLLFTNDYHEFCMNYFGEFFHHYPLKDEDKKTPNELYKIELRRYLTYIYDKLGDQTLKKWFGECILD